MLALLLAAGLCREHAALKARAKIDCAVARKTALGKAPGRVISAELEEEGGKLVYSFDVKQKGKKGIEEVQIDATSGDVVSVQHETAAQEAKEKD
jgi:uncharacterized membrane protein YkoI